MLCSFDWYIVTDVSGQPISPTFEGQEVHAEFYLDCLTLKRGPIRCPKTWVTNYQTMLCNTTEENDLILGRPFLTCSGDQSVSMMKLFSTKKQNLGLLFSSAELSGFLDYQMKLILPY